MESPEMAMRSPEQNTSEQRQQMVKKLASLFHEEWRATRIKEDGSYEPRIKETKDSAWIAAHKTEEVDIANTPFEDLPADWQAENMAAAEVAMKVVFQAIESGRDLDESFVEEASSTVHDEWLKRNGEWAPAEQKKPFAELNKEDQEKDRAQVIEAIKIFKSSE